MPDVLLSVGAGTRLLATFLFLVWTVQASTAVQGGVALADMKGTISAAEPLAQPTIPVRDIARYLRAETSRSETGTHMPVIEGGGKFAGIASEVRLPLETASGTSFAIWYDARPPLPPVRAVGARGPPPLAA